MMIDIEACIVCTSFRSESSKVALFQVRIPDTHDVVSYILAFKKYTFCIIYNA